jgi:hypothetical protein
MLGNFRAVSLCFEVVNTGFWITITGSEFVGVGAMVVLCMFAPFVYLQSVSSCPATVKSVLIPFSIWKEGRNFMLH